LPLNRPPKKKGGRGKTHHSGSARAHGMGQLLSASDAELALYDESSFATRSTALSSSSRNLSSCFCSSSSGGVLSRRRFLTQGFVGLTTPLSCSITAALFSARSRYAHKVFAEMWIGSHRDLCSSTKASVAKSWSWR
jgi:hypothetical protein